MTPDVDLMLATLERALAVSVVPGATTASAREEAALALLFSRWVREVLDPLPAIERASLRDCAETLADVAAVLERSAHPAAAITREAAAEVIGADASASERRAEIRRRRSALGLVLREVRDSGDAALADDVRLRLFDLGWREIERERAFGKPAGVDPESPSLPRLEDLARRGNDTEKGSP